MTLGLAPKQGDLLGTTVGYCEGRVGADSIYAVLNRECFTLFPDEMFADLFTDVGRRSVPPMIVAVVMVLQRIEGCSDREAVDRFTFDARWKYAAGGLAFDYPGFVHTVLVDMRARLAASGRPDRIFEVTLAAAKAAGLVGRKRVLDSTPLYDAVATMDTVTLIRSGIRGVLKAAGADQEAELRAVIGRDDDYAAAGKPVCDYDDRAARKLLVDALAKDGTAVLAVLDGRELDPAATQAGALLATVLGQDLDIGEDGVFTIARRVAPDRVISTVDPPDPARAQDLSPPLRRLQGPYCDRPRCRGHHRDRGHRGQHRRRSLSCWPATSPTQAAPTTPATRTQPVTRRQPEATRATTPSRTVPARTTRPNPRRRRWRSTATPRTARVPCWQTWRPPGRRS